MKRPLLILLLISIAILSFMKPKKISYRTIYIDSQKENCQYHDTLQTCFRYTFNKKYPYRALLTKSLKFNYEEGYEYKIKVKVLREAREATQYQEDYQFVQIISKIKKENPMPSNEEQTHSISIFNQWILESFPKEKQLEKPIEKSSYFTINKEKNEINGNTGCNSFGGGVNIQGDKITFINLFQTERYCEEAAAQEQLFMEQLMKANRFAIQGAELMLFENDTLLMTMESYR